MLNTFNQSMLKALQRMRRGGQYGNGGKVKFTPKSTDATYVKPPVGFTQFQSDEEINEFGKVRYPDTSIDVNRIAKYNNQHRPYTPLPPLFYDKPLQYQGPYVTPPNPGYGENYNNFRNIWNNPTESQYAKGGSIGTGPYWAPNPGIPTNPRYNQAAINQEAMYEPAPSTIGPPMYPTTAPAYNDGQVGMGVKAPQVSTPTFAPPAPTGPTMAEVSSNYQPVRVNQRNFDSAFGEAKRAGLKTFEFRNKLFTTDERTSAGKVAARKAVVSAVSNKNNTTIPNNPYIVTASNPQRQRQSQGNGNSIPWGKIAGATAVTGAGMAYWGLGTGAIKYPEGYMTPGEFVKDAKKNIASKYMTPKELLASMKKVKYPSNYMTPGEFTKGVTDKLKGMKTPKIPSYPSNYMTPNEFIKSVTEKPTRGRQTPAPTPVGLPPKTTAQRRLMPRYPAGYMTPKEVTQSAVNDLRNIKFPKINVNNISERIGTKAYQVPALRSSVATADKAYKTMEKTAKRLFKHF